MRANRNETSTKTPAEMAWAAHRDSDRYRQAARKLAGDGTVGVVGGRLARYYEGMAHRSLGIEAIQSGRFAAGEKHMRAALEYLGRRADLTGYLCSIYVKTGRYDRCADEMSRSAETSQNDADGWRGAAQAQWRAGRREEAYMTLTSAIRRFGNRPQLLMQLGLFYAAECNYEQAGYYLEKASRADASNADAHRYLALACAAQGQLEAAARSFQRAWELRPQDVMLGLQLATTARAAAANGQNIVVRLVDPNPAESSDSHIRQMAAYVQRNCDFVDAFLALPKSDVDEDLFGVLSNVLCTALGEHPGYADMQFRASRVCRRLGRAEQAISHCEKALHANPRYVQAMLHLASLHQAGGRSEDASVLLQEAIRCGADWPDVHCHAGELMLTGDRPDEAGAHFRRALELKSEYPRAAKALASLAA